MPKPRSGSLRTAFCGLLCGLLALVAAPGLLAGCARDGMPQEVSREVVGEATPAPGRHGGAENEPSGSTSGSSTRDTVTSEERDAAGGSALPLMVPGVGTFGVPADCDFGDPFSTCQ